jgi:hypothetical protein
MVAAWRHLVLAVVMVFALRAFAAVADGTVDQQDAETAGARALKGAIDIHLHVDPDSDPRPIDALDVAKLARARGLRGIVLKNHYDPTGGLAFIVRKETPGLEVFGGIDLNLTVGGINVAAVEHMTQVKGGWGRVVWMPTHDAENEVRDSKQNRPFVSVARDGALLPQVKEVITVIAKHGLVLETGHSSAEEGLMLIREGRRQGAQHMVVTHAMDLAVKMSIAQMQEAAKLGAYIEFDMRNTLTGARTDAIRKIGPEFCILSEFWSSREVYAGLEGISAFVTEMGKRGFTERELDMMMKGNPARLLGLPAQ